MKRYEQIIDLEKLWDNCQYWTLNRAFAQGNPNRSREDLNDTYGLTADDKKFFFDDYVEYVASEFVTSGLFRLLRDHNEEAFDHEDFLIDNGYLHIFFVAGNKFPDKHFNTILYKYFQFRILWWWYKLKNLDAELQKINYYLSIEADKIASVVSDYVTDKSSSVGWLAYNDGFITQLEDLDEKGKVAYDTLPLVSTQLAPRENTPSTQLNDIHITDLPTRLVTETDLITIPCEITLTGNSIYEREARFRVEVLRSGELTTDTVLEGNNADLQLALLPHTWNCIVRVPHSCEVSLRVTMTHSDGTLSVYNSNRCLVVSAVQIFTDTFNEVFQ